MQVDITVEEINKELPEELRAAAHAAATQLLSAGHGVTIGHGVMLAAWQLYQLGYVLTRSALEHAPPEGDQETALRGVMSSAVAAAFAPFDTAALKNVLQALCIPMMHKLNARLDGKVVSALPLTAPAEPVLVADRPYVIMCADKDALRETLQTRVVDAAVRDNRNVLVISDMPDEEVGSIAGSSLQGLHLGQSWWDALWQAGSSERLVASLLRDHSIMHGGVWQAAPRKVDMVVVRGLPAHCKASPAKAQAALRRLKYLQQALRCVLVVGVADDLATWRECGPAATSVIAEKYLLRNIRVVRSEREDGAVLSCTLEDNWAQFDLPLVLETVEPAAEKVESDESDAAN